MSAYALSSNAFSVLFSSFHTGGTFGFVLVLLWPSAIIQWQCLKWISKEVSTFWRKTVFYTVCKGQDACRWKSSLFTSDLPKRQAENGIMSHDPMPFPVYHVLLFTSCLRCHKIKSIWARSKSKIKWHLHLKSFKTEMTLTFKWPWQRLQMTLKISICNSFRITWARSKSKTSNDIYIQRALRLKWPWPSNDLERKCKIILNKIH